jgi:hypothetical protein
MYSGKIAVPPGGGGIQNNNVLFFQQTGVYEGNKIKYLI